jgi:hypothetical protein
MPSGRGLLLIGGTTLLAGGQNPIVLIEGGESETQFSASAGQDPLQGGDAGLPFAALDSRYLRLGYPGPFGQLPLDRPASSRAIITSPAATVLALSLTPPMITDKLSQQAAFCVLPPEYARPRTAAQYDG